MTSKILRLPEVIQKTGLSRSSIYTMMSKDNFPKQRKLGIRSVGWFEDEINEWISNRLRKGL